MIIINLRNKNKATDSNKYWKKKFAALPPSTIITDWESLRNAHSIEMKFNKKNKVQKRSRIAIKNKALNRARKSNNIKSKQAYHRAYAKTLITRPQRTPDVEDAINTRKAFLAIEPKEECRILIIRE